MSCSTCAAAAPTSAPSSPALEGWLIRALAAFNVAGERREDRVGIWVARPERAPAARTRSPPSASGVRRWVTFHGISLNVAPDLTHFAGIVPCGVHEHGVTSLADLGIAATMDDVDAALRESFRQVFERMNSG